VAGGWKAQSSNHQNKIKFNLVKADGFIFFPTTSDQQPTTK